MLLSFCLCLLLWMLISAGPESNSSFSILDKNWGQWYGSLLCLPIRCVFSRFGNRASVSGKLSECWVSQVKLCAKLWQQNSIWKTSSWGDSTQWERILWAEADMRKRKDCLGYFQAYKHLDWFYDWWKVIGNFKKGWDDLGEWHWNMYNIIYETSSQSRFDAWYRMLGAGALGWPRGMLWGRKWEGDSGWGTRVHLWRIHVDVWQNQCSIVK